MKRSISRRQRRNLYNIAARVYYVPYVARYHKAVTNSVELMERRIRSRKNRIVLRPPNAPPRAFGRGLFGAVFFLRITARATVDPLDGEQYMNAEASSDSTVAFLRYEEDAYIALMRFLLSAQP